MCIRDSDGTWTLPGVTLDTVGNYRIRVIAIDNAGNTAQSSENPSTDFSVVPDAASDTENPEAEADSPGNITVGSTFAITGTASDDISGVSRVRVRVQRLGGSIPSFVDATLNGDGTWTLPGVTLNTVGNYRIRVIAIDNAGNTAQSTENPFTDFSVN